MPCSDCDGQPQFIENEIAQQLGKLLGPKRTSMYDNRGRDVRRVNQHGAKGVVKFNPTTEESLRGWRSQFSAVDWQSPDGEPRWVTVDVGRIEAGGGGSFPAASVVQTVARGAINAAGILTVVSTDGFPTSGTLARRRTSTGVVATGVAYTGVTATTFTGMSAATTVSADDTIFRPLSYLARAQVILGSPSAMEDPFYIDVGRGQRFVASASFVGVTIQALEPPTNYSAGSINVIGRLGHGEAGTQAPLIYTLPINSLAAAGTKNVVIPPRANFLLPLWSSDLNNTVQLDFLDEAGALINSLEFTNGGMVAPASLEDAHSITVTNDGASTATYRLPFQISS